MFTKIKRTTYETKATYPNIATIRLVLVEHIDVNRAINGFHEMLTVCEKIDHK